MKYLMLAVLCGVASGCATIVKSPNQTILLNGGLEDGTTKVSTPTGNYGLAGGYTTIMVPRTRADIPIEVTCGGVTQKTVIQTRFDVFLGGLGNVVFGGIIGWIVDGTGDKAYDAPAAFNVSSYCRHEQRATATVP